MFSPTYTIGLCKRVLVIQTGYANGSQVASRSHAAADTPPTRLFCMLGSQMGTHSQLGTPGGRLMTRQGHPFTPWPHHTHGCPFLPRYPQSAHFAIASVVGRPDFAANFCSSTSRSTSSPLCSMLSSSPAEMTVRLPATSGNTIRSATTSLCGRQCQEAVCAGERVLCAALQPRP
jgi:hypothetical protein